MNIASVNRAQMLLKLTYALVPIIIGLDKIFTWMLVDWAKYSSPVIIGLLPISMTTLHFVMLTGIIEVIAGIFVWFYPRLGAYTIVAWMALVIVNLATMNQFYDIIARDGVIAVGALALAWLS
ncbi:MAG: hypothetical protein M1114_00485 [Candidatus Dependentiae bacterium]|nr:hypothetical protein [Candidatus Dependentiae bacterium]